ncbi:unnamed protein product [Ixodes pacificus]
MKGVKPKACCGCNMCRQHAAARWQGEPGERRMGQPDGRAVL